MKQSQEIYPAEKQDALRESYWLGYGQKCHLTQTRLKQLNQIPRLTPISRKHTAFEPSSPLRCIAVELKEICSRSDHSSVKMQKNFRYWRRF
uniref:Uncharacterized protein n=1 Tax=Parascaris univalens TaxID=6257 RepID=A0A914ZGX0_PARUN